MLPARTCRETVVVNARGSYSRVLEGAGPQRNLVHDDAGQSEQWRWLVLNSLHVKTRRERHQVAHTPHVGTLAHAPVTPRRTTPRATTHPSRAMGLYPSQQRLRCRGEIMGNQDLVREEVEELLKAFQRVDELGLPATGCTSQGLRLQSAPAHPYKEPGLDYVLPPAGAGDECLAIPESLQSPAMRSSIHMAIQQNPSSGRLQMSLRPSTGPRPGTASSSVSLSSRGLGFPTRPYTAGTRKASFSRNQRLGTHKSSHIPSSHIPNVHLAPQCNSSPFVTDHWWGFSGEDKARLNGNSAKREGAKKMHLLGPERRVVLALWKGFTDKLLEIHGPKAKAQLERGFLDDVGEADHAV
mmetsp:Transcript_3888/g.6243  ORF Transcript_3888/g.6243 Transcript_3888/m.6243 type:complete len:354 (-) Transcript_3888:65-1126(-)